MGRASVAAHQERIRGGRLERRLEMPVLSTLSATAATMVADQSVAEVVHTALPAARALSLPVVEDGVYLGMVRAADLVEVPPEGREAMPVGNLLAEVPAVRPNATLGEALAAMEEGGVDRVAVADGRRFVGVVVREELLQLDRALEAVEDRREDEA